MAQIESSEKNGKKRNASVSTKIDMTHMVDLAFLLITFFMLTTTFTKSKALELIMPAGDEPGQQRASKAITVLLGEQDKVYWYTGSEEAASELHLSNYSSEGIRQILIKKNKEIGKDFTVLIKALDKSKYKNMVDILDEMTITNTRRFAVVKTTENDLAMIAKQ